MNIIATNWLNGWMASYTEYTFGIDDNINYMVDGNAVELVLTTLKTHVKVSNLLCDDSV